MPPAELEEIDFLETAHVSIEPALALPAEPVFEAPAPIAAPVAAEPEPEPAQALHVEPEAAAGARDRRRSPRRRWPSCRKHCRQSPSPRWLRRARRSEVEPERPAAPSADDQVKVIGPLRIGIALYNVYLNEADEWSRQLATEVGEWALESHERVSDSTIGLAHSLAGSSATVGFQGLSDMARSLEAALQHLHMQRPRHAGSRARCWSRRPKSCGACCTSSPPASCTSPPKKPCVRCAMSAASPMPLDMGEAAIGSVASLRFAVADVALDDSEDAIDVSDVVDVDLFPIFEEEAAELLPQLGAALREWSQHPEDRGAARFARCAPCTRSRAVPGWPAPCGWANVRTAWNPRSRRSAPRARTARRSSTC